MLSPLRPTGPPLPSPSPPRVLREVAPEQPLDSFTLASAPAVVAAPVCAPTPEPEAPPVRGVRLEAAVGAILEQYGEPSAARDQLLLQGFLREGRSSEELQPYQGLLQDPGASFQVDQAPLFDYAHVAGYDVARIGAALDRMKPIYGELRALAQPLPAAQQTMYRYSPAAWKDDTLKLMADGRMDIGELYLMRGFGTLTRIDGCDQAAMYVADNPESGRPFGDTRQTITLAPSAVYLDNTDSSVLDRFDALCQRYGVYDVYGHTAAREDLYYKAGIDVVRDVEDNLVQSRPDAREKMRSYYNGQGFFKVFNPEVITDIR